MQTSLRIKQKHLISIVKGEKKEEYRAINSFNVSRLCVLKKDYTVEGFKNIDAIKFYVGNEKNGLFAIVQVLGIFQDEFETEIAGAPAPGSICFTIELGDILETNVNL
jgi:hypothetical protein